MKLFELQEESLENLLIRDCAKFIKELPILSDKKQLWRGIEKQKYALRNKPHPKRRPLDTPIEVHKKLNVYFEQKFGWPARQGLFCTASKGFAHQYGDGMVVAVFPIGDYKYVWSPDVSDIYGLYLDMDEFLEPKNIKWEEVKKQLDEAEWKNSQMIELFNVSEGIEISFKCDEFYFLKEKDVKTINWQNVHKAVSQ
jgi:hypothetical protein